MSSNHPRPLSHTPPLVRSLLALLLGLVLVAPVQALPEYELRQVQVLHRHGARSPIVDYNESAICGTEYLCGHLNAPGQAMLRNLGAFLRARYTADADVVDPAAPYLTSDAYNLTVSYSRSTDVLRTLQSSVAMLRGLFPDMDSFYPAVHTMERDTDMLYSNAFPAVRVRRNYGDAEAAAACLPVVDEPFPDHAVLREMAAEVHSEAFCARYEDRLSCAYSLCDIGLAYEATDQLKQCKKLKANLDEVCAATACLFRFLYGFNASDSAQVKQGSVGQGAAQEMLRNMRTVVENDAGKSANPGFKVYEMSAHDTTVVPLSVTLGDDSARGMMPPFGTAFVVELLSKRRAKSGGGRKNKREDETAAYDYFVRVLRGNPGVTPDTDYRFAFTPFEMRCMTRQGAVYVTEQNVCPFDDFVRLVDSTKPKHSAGLCYVDPVLLARMDCPKTGVHGARLSSDCLHFRRLCPDRACDSGYFLSAVDYGCYRATADGGGSGGGSAATVGVAAVAFFIGGLVGLVLLILKRQWDDKRRRDGYELPV